MNDTHKIGSHRSSNRPKYGYIDKTGKVVIDLPDYGAIGSFSEGLAPVLLENKWGFIDTTGSLRIKPRFERVLGFSEGLAGMKIDGLWGFIDRAGNIVIQPEYEIANQFSEGMAVVVRGISKRQSQMPMAGRPRSIQVEVRSRLLSTTAIEHDAPISAHRGDKEVLIIDKTGHPILSRSLNEAVQIKYDEDARFSEGVIEAFDEESERYGFIDKSFKFVIDPKYDQVARFSEGLARVAIFEKGEERIGFIDRTGRFVISPKFNTDADFRNSSDFSEGLAALTEGLNPLLTEQEKFAYINKAGSIELLTEFREAHPFREGLALVHDEKSNKWGFIDKSGSMVIAAQFEFARDFSEGLAAISLGN